MRWVELVGVVVVLAALGLLIAALAAVVRIGTGVASRLGGTARRVSSAARQPDELAVAAANRLVRMTDPAEVSDLRLRVTLRRRVSAAASAVRTAELAGAPVGDLPQVAARLSQHCVLVEQRLATLPPSPRGVAPSPLRASARADAEALLAMAEQTHQAAGDALGGLSVPTSRALAAEVSDAVAGVRAASAWLRERGPGRPRPGST